MDIRIAQCPIEDVDATVLVVPAFDREAPREAALNNATEGWVDEMYSSGEFGGSACDIALLHRPKGLKTARLMLAGGGKPGKFTEFEMRRLAGAAVRAVKGKSLRHVHIWLAEAYATASFAQALVEAAILADYEP